LVLGCDQVLEFDGKAMAKAGSREDARVKLMALRGRTHRLLSAVVLYDSKKPVWRHVATASLTMRNFSDAYLDSYLDRNWPSVADSVGAYKLEAEGLRLFHAIEGDYFTILGLPMLQLVSYLCQRGFLSE
jgi:septum formation protein